MKKAKPAISEEDQSSESAKMLEALGYVDEEPSGREQFTRGVDFALSWGRFKFTRRLG